MIIGLGIVEGAVKAAEAFEKGISKEVIEVEDETHNAELNNIPKAKLKLLDSLLQEIAISNLSALNY